MVLWEKAQEIREKRFRVEADRAGVLAKERAPVDPRGPVLELAPLQLDEERRVDLRRRGHDLDGEAPTLTRLA